MRAHCRSLWAEGDRVVRRWASTDPWQSGVVRLSWRAVRGDVELPYQVDVSVAVYDGRVSELAYTRTEPTVPIEPTVTREQAVATARKAAQDAGALGADAAVLTAQCAVAVRPDGQRLVWGVSLAAPEALASPADLPREGVQAFGAEVDALTGSIIAAEPYRVFAEDMARLARQLRPEGPRPPPLHVKTVGSSGAGRSATSLVVSNRPAPAARRGAPHRWRVHGRLADKCRTDPGQPVSPHRVSA